MIRDMKNERQINYKKSEREVNQWKAVYDKWNKPFDGTGFNIDGVQQR